MNDESLQRANAFLAAVSERVAVGEVLTDTPAEIGRALGMPDALSTARAGYKKGYQDVTFPKFERYVADAADMAKIIRGEKASDFPAAHDLAVQETVLQACGVG